MNAVERFLIYTFSSFVARHYNAKPGDLLFARMLERVNVAAKLSHRESQVMFLHLFGLGYAEISRQLFISEDTVAKHVKSAHRKTGCTSFLELFRPYFVEPTQERQV